MLFKPLAVVTSFFFTTGTILLLFFIILGGTKTTGVTSRFYYFRAETGSIFPNAPGISQWSFWGVCGFNGTDAKHPGERLGCSEHHPAFGFDPRTNFEIPRDEVPEPFIKHHHLLYYASRILFPFFVIGLFFEVAVLFMWIPALRSRFWMKLTWLSNFIGFLFITVAAAVVTAFNTKARGAFHEAGVESVKLGQIVIAFAWTCVFMIICQFCLLIWIGPSCDSADSGAAYYSGGYANTNAATAGSSRRYRFGLGAKRTTEGGAEKDGNNAGVVDDAVEQSSYVRA